MKRLSTIALALSLSACATTYGELGSSFWEDGGVATDQITADTYRIRSRVNQNTDPAVVSDFALLRAAETVRMNCGTHFVIEGDEDQTRVEESYTPATESRSVEKVKDKEGKVKVVEHVHRTDESWSVAIKPGADFYIRALSVRPGAAAPEHAIPVDEVLAHVGSRVVRRKNAPPPVFPTCGQG